MIGPRRSFPREAQGRAFASYPLSFCRHGGAVQGSDRTQCDKKVPAERTPSGAEVSCPKGRVP